MDQKEMKALVRKLSDQSKKKQDEKERRKITMKQKQILSASDIMRGM